MSPFGAMDAAMAPPGPPMIPGAGGGPGADLASATLDRVVPKSPNPTASMANIEEALTTAHKLVMSAIPQLTQMNPKVAKDLHGVARSLMGAKLDLKKEMQPQAPPDLMMGMGAGGGPPGGATPFGGGMAGAPSMF